MRERGLRAASDYENTSTPNSDNKQYEPTNSHVVYYGINTDWYTPTYDKKDYFLWLGRWHEVRGYRMMIDIAKRTGINLIMAGEHPDRERFEYQRNCAYEALELAANVPNIKFEWLPPDPNHHEAKRALYQGAKAFINTVQFQEPFGLQQAEALACGTPVIGTRMGALPEVIQHGLTGYICDNNIKDFQVAINMIDRIDPKICREQAVSRFDRKIMAKAYLAEYEFAKNGVVW
jgi:glycosyltransferase involved in cell wall biosynthesis